MTSKPAVLAASLLLVAGAAAWGWQELRSNDAASAAGPSTQASGGGAKSDGGAPADRLRRGLVDAGWTEDAAAAVAELNRNWLAAVAEADDDEPARALNRLKPLGRVRGLMPLLAKRPESAGLLAAAQDPQAVAETLRSDADYPLVRDLYKRYESDPDALAAALLRHRERIVRLGKRGVLPPETPFLFPRTETAASRREAVAEHDRWLADEFDTALAGAAAGDDETLGETLLLVEAFGSVARRRLIDDPAFRARFRGELWPALERLVDDGTLPLVAAINDPFLLDVLGLPDGPRLVERWGMLAVEVLGTRGRFPEKLRPHLVATMLAGDEAMMQTLTDHAGRPLLVALLERSDVSGDTRAMALRKVHEAGADADRTLRHFAGLSGTALSEESRPEPSRAPSRPNGRPRRRSDPWPRRRRSSSAGRSATRRAARQASTTGSNRGRSARMRSRSPWSGSIRATSRTGGGSRPAASRSTRPC